ncbi:hypothetical protein L0F63_002402 [Massospora cicadina]|nr:hypothetical protein L0F63_002402 [Massospora cicadina]
MGREFPLQTSFLKGKCIFLTGGTGFVGKAILELLIRDHHPHVGHIYCLVRGRKGQKVQDRLVGDVLTNKLFNVVRDRLGPLKFRDEVESKLTAIEGDISLPGLGISVKDRELLKSKLNVVIHCAATVDFNERLDRSLTLNTLGTMQLLDLCDECVGMDGFVHVSTAYVNSNRHENVIYERVYPMVFGDPTELVARIRKMDLPEIAEFTKEITAVYPNTYTFTKSLAENMILERAEAMRLRELATSRPAWSLAIVRPTVVTSTAADPVPGWVDGVSAANGIALYIGLGVMDSTPGPRGSVLDLVPVDYLANVVMRACAAFRPPGVRFTLALADPTRKVRSLTEELPIDPHEEVYPAIYHAASSAINPVTWDQFGTGVVASWAKLPKLRKQVFPPAFQKYSSDMEYSAMLHLKQQFKFTTVAMLLAIGDPTRGERLRSLRKKLDFLYHCFTHFMTRAWSFQAASVIRVEERQRALSVVSSRLDSAGLKAMPWEGYLDFFIYGMYYFVLNESQSIRPPRVAQGRPSLTCDEVAYVTPANPWLVANAHQLRSKFIHDDAVQACLSEIDSEPARAKQRLLSEVILGERILGGLSGPNHLQNWLASGVESIHVNRSKVLKLRDMLNLRPSARVLYLPTHHSNLDFALLCHVLENCSLPLPLIAADGDTTLKGCQVKRDTLVVRSLFSTLSASSAAKQILTRQYLVRLLQAKGSATIFLDSPTLQRGGGNDFSNGSVVESLNAGKVHDLVSSDLFASLLSALRAPDSGISLDDVIVVPLAISHETGLDMGHIGDGWSRKVNLSQEIARITGDGSRGRVHVAFGNAMDLSRLVNQADQIRQLGILDLSLTHPSYMVRSWQMQCQIVSPVSLLAMVLGAYRSRRGIPFDRARTLLVKLRDEALALGYNVDWQSGEDSSAMLCYCLEAIGPNHVNIEMVDDDQDFSGPTPAQVRGIILKGDESSALRLRALVGQIQHVFIFDSIFMAAHQYCHRQSRATGMGLPTLNDLQKVYVYLATLLAHHHPEISVLGTLHDFKVVVKRLERCEMVQLMDTESDSMVVLNNDRLHQDFLRCTQAMIHPTLDSYWATCCALALLPNLRDIRTSKFIALVQENIREACAKGLGRYPESVAAPTIYSALSCLSHLGLVDIINSKVDESYEPRLSISQRVATESSKLNRYLNSWCPVSTTHGGKHLDHLLDDGDNGQSVMPRNEHRSFLVSVEQVGFSIEQFRSTSQYDLSLPTVSPEPLASFPQLVPAPTLPTPTVRSDSSNPEPTFRLNPSSPPSNPNLSLSTSLILSWGHYLNRLLNQTQGSSFEKLPPTTIDLFKPNHHLPSSPAHSRDNSRS